MSNVKYRLLAYSNAAGKFNPEAPQQGNEDNYEISFDIGKGIFKGVFDQDTEMPECGILMCVADGMGGMNAGEVASDIAVKTVDQYFAAGKITPNIALDSQKRRVYLEKVIVAADSNIKEDAKNNSEHSGMGSTIILAWIVDNSITISWCGDSRAYRFNPSKGIELLSKDHSYVQELADKGVITYEDTFDHPQNNIVTRSLGDPNKKAIPESREFPVYENDIILLCSDGLSGVLRDRKTYYRDGELIPGENLEDIIAAHSSSLVDCRDALWAAAERADWYDNVTTLLCKIIASPSKAVVTSQVPANSLLPTPESQQYPQPHKTKKVPLLAVIIPLLIILGGGFWYLISKDKKLNAKNEKFQRELDSIKVHREAEQAKGTIDTVSDPSAKPINQEGIGKQGDESQKGTDKLQDAKKQFVDYANTFKNDLNTDGIKAFNDLIKEVRNAKTDNSTEWKTKLDDIKRKYPNIQENTPDTPNNPQEEGNIVGDVPHNILDYDKDRLYKDLTEAKAKVNDDGKKEIDKLIGQLPVCSTEKLVDKLRTKLNEILKQERYTTSSKPGSKKNVPATDSLNPNTGSVLTPDSSSIK